MLYTLIVFILVLSALVFVHELGHFWTARKLGVKAEEFGFGFPPRAFGWRKVKGHRQFFWGNAEHVESEDTIYSINWLPLGGFVKIKGEEGDSKNDPDSFAGRPIWQRFLILTAGVTMNVILTAVCLMFVFALGAPQVIDGETKGAIVQEPRIQIIQVLKNTPADKAGIQMGDVILKLDNQEFTEVKAVQDYLTSKVDNPVMVVVERGTELKELTVTTINLTETGKPGIGVALAKTGIVRYPWYLSIWLGIKGAFSLFVQIIVAFYTIIKHAILGQPIGVDVSGPIGIAVMTGRVARLGFVYILQFAALLSMNLAIINFLPFPALDGGRVLFLIIEKFRGKAANEKIEQIIHTVGFSLLMLLIVVVTGRDLWQFKSFFINLFH